MPRSPGEIDVRVDLLDLNTGDLSRMEIVNTCCGVRPVYPSLPKANRPVLWRAFNVAGLLEDLSVEGGVALTNRVLSIHPVLS